jgi:hypothetical protein
LTLRVFHKNAQQFRFRARNELLGEISIKITDLIENGEVDIHIFVPMLTIFVETRFPLKDENNADTNARVGFRLAIEAIENNTITTPDLIDAGVQLAKATETAQTIGSWEAPLGKAVQSSEQIMNLVGGVAEASQSFCILHGTMKADP